MNLCMLHVGGARGKNRKGGGGEESSIDEIRVHKERESTSNRYYMRKGFL